MKDAQWPVENKPHLVRLGDESNDSLDGAESVEAVIDEKTALVDNVREKVVIIISSNHVTHLFDALDDGVEDL